MKKLFIAFLVIVLPMWAVSGRLIIPITSGLAGYDTTICIGTSAILTATGGVSYNWSSGQPTQTITVSPTITTTYIVTVTDNLGGSSTDDVIVYVNPLPVANTGTDTSICNGEYVSYTATGGYSYLWSTSAITASITINPSSSVTLWVNVYDSIGCASSDTVSVTVFPTPVANGGSDTSICIGNSVTFTATGGGAGGVYTWNTSPPLTNPQITVTPLVNTVYTVSVSNPFGCTDVDDVILYVNPLITASASGDTSICTGTSASLSASGGALYVWNSNPVQFGPQISVNPIVSTTYTVTVSDSLGCSDTDDVIVNVYPNPVANAGPDTTICFGDTITIVGGNGPYFFWNTSPPQMTPSITVNPVSNTLYVLTVMDNLGCYSTDAVVVNVNQPPPANAGSDVSLCDGNTVVLSASGGTSYYWNSTPSQTTATISVSPSVTTNYTVVVSDAAGCSSTDDVTVTVYPSPVATASNDTIICSGDLITLSATGGNAYSWSTSQTTSSISIAPTVSTTYFVTASNIYQCTDIEDIVVTVNQIPSANAGPDITVCYGDTTTLIATGSFFYIWGTIPVQNNDTIIIVPLNTATYNVTVSDSIGCSGYDSLVVTVQSLPVVDIGSDTAICYGDTITFDAGAGPFNYLWQNSATNQSLQTNITGLYWVEVTDQLGCKGSDSVLLTVMPPLSVNLGSDTTVCLGTPALLDAGAGFTSYLWQDNSTNQTYSVFSPGLYWVEVADSIGCNMRDSMNVDIYQLPVVDLGNDTSVCFGSSVTFDGGQGFVAYLWHDFSTVQQFTTSVAGNYWVIVTDTNLCQNIDSVNLVINPLPQISLANDTSICSDDSIILDPGSGFASYLWQDGTSTQTYAASVQSIYWVEVVDYNDCSSRDSMELSVNDRPKVELGYDRYICENAKFNLDGGKDAASYLWHDGSTGRYFLADNPGIYYVTVSNGDCVEQDTVIFTQCSELWVPSAFTPDNDGLNDIFKAVSDTITKFQMLIYDRWGNIVFESNDINTGWDGTFKGQTCPVGVYTWLIIFDSVLLLT